MLKERGGCAVHQTFVSAMVGGGGTGGGIGTSHTLPIKQDWWHVLTRGHSRRRCPRARTPTPPLTRPPGRHQPPPSTSHYAAIRSEPFWPRLTRESSPAVLLHASTFSLFDLHLESTPGQFSTPIYYSLIGPPCPLPKVSPQPPQLGPTMSWANRDLPGLKFV